MSADALTPIRGRNITPSFCLRRNVENPWGRENFRDDWAGLSNIAWNVTFGDEKSGEEYANISPRNSFFKS